MRTINHHQNGKETYYGIVPKTKFSISKNHRRRGFTILMLVEEAVRLSPAKGMTCDEIVSSVWQRHRVVLTKKQVNDASAHLRNRGLLAPTDLTKKHAFVFPTGNNSKKRKK